MKGAYIVHGKDEKQKILDAKPDENISLERTRHTLDDDTNTGFK